MTKHRPTFYVFAGNNGSGKSTIRNLLIDKIGVDINIDPDAIAKRLDSINPESKRVSAGKEVIKSVYKHINERTNFLYRQHFRVKLVLIDNSLDDGKIILEVNNSFITFEADYLPAWARPIKEQLEMD